MRSKALVLALLLSLVAVSCGDDDQIADGTTSTTASGTSAPQQSETGTAAASDPGGATSATDGDGCPDETFLVDEVNSYRQTGGYADPELTVECTGDVMVVTTNNIPTFEFVQMTPNDLQAQDLVYEIPLSPVAADTPGAMGLGAVGVTVTGLSVFAAFEAPQDGYRDPYLDGLLDYCNGHTAQQGFYHFHARMDCLFDATDLVGLVYGYAFDGYEMVSPWICVDEACTEVREVTSSYVRIDDDGLGAFEAWEYRAGAGDLDECNGMVGADGVYRYHITDEFPYVPFCYHGETEWAQGDFEGEAPAGGPGANAMPAIGGQDGVMPPPPGRP